MRFYFLSMYMSNNNNKKINYDCCQTSEDYSLTPLLLLCALEMNLETSKQVMILVVFPLRHLCEKRILEALDGSKMHMGIKRLF